MVYQNVEILLVEDSAADAEMTLRTLKKASIANSVEWVRDGVEALEYLFCEGQYEGRSNGRPRMVLLDLKMPRMDGMQVLERMKADARTVLELLDKASKTSDHGELEAIRAQVTRAMSDVQDKYADNPAYQAYLEMKRTLVFGASA